MQRSSNASVFMFSQPDDGVVQFHEAALLQPDHWLELQRVVQRRVLRTTLRAVPSARTASSTNPMPTACSPGRAPAGSASMPPYASRATTEAASSDSSAGYPPKVGGARPPFSLERLHAPAGTRSLASTEARLVYRLPRPTPDGRTELRLSPLDLLERLARLRILAFLTDPPIVSAILLHLELHHEPPPISPARGPPQGDFLLDQTPALDPSEGEPAPGPRFARCPCSTSRCPTS